MTAFAFDTHKVIKDLEKAGFDEAQAEAVVAALGTVIGGNLVTKADLDVFKAEMKAEMQANTADLKAEIKEEISSVRSESKEETTSLRSEMKEESASIRSEFKAEASSIRSAMQSLELRMTLRLGAIVVVAAAVATAIARFV